MYAVCDCSSCPLYSACLTMLSSLFLGIVSKQIPYSSCYLFHRVENPSVHYYWIVYAKQQALSPFVRLSNSAFSTCTVSASVIQSIAFIALLLQLYGPIWPLVNLGRHIVDAVAQRSYTVHSHEPWSEKLHPSSKGEAHHYLLSLIGPP